ncbi:MAG TPA: carbohydrate ABC transporter permease, partial [Clostridia bacterium]|nr:carbohydrate ABC transporter permease [Clostridia bacterium]
MLKRSLGEKVFNVFNLIGFFLFTLLMLIPITFVIKTSLDVSPVGELQLSLLPQEPSLLFYRLVIQDESVWRPFMNSIIVTVLGTSFSMLINALGAYTLSKKELPGSRFFIYFLIIIPMLFGGGIVPSYLLIRALGLIDTLPVLFVPNMASGWNMILIRNYYWSIPQSLGESARIDGAQEFTVFFKIILPLSKPVLSAIALFTGVGYWNTFMAAVLYIRDSRKYTFPVKLDKEMETYTLDITNGKVKIVNERKDVQPFFTFQNNEFRVSYLNFAEENVKFYLYDNTTNKLVLEKNLS